MNRPSPARKHLMSLFPRRPVLVVLASLAAATAAAEESPYFRFTAPDAKAPGTAPPSTGTDNTDVPPSKTLTVSAPPAMATRSGGDYASPQPTANNATGPVTWSWAPGTSPPSWASVDATTGVVHGIAGNYGSFPNLALQARDSTGYAQTVPFKLEVLPPPTASVPVGQTEALLRVGSPLSITPAASNIAGTATWSIPYVSGNIPNGLGLDSRTGTLSGTVTGVGSATFPFLVTDSYDNAEAATRQVTVTAYAPLAFASAPGDVTAPPGVLITAPPPRLLNRVGSVSYALGGTQEPASSLGGACPGLRFDGTSGSIVGTPTAPCGLSGLSLTATDDGNGVQGLASRVTSGAFALRANSDLHAALQPGSPVVRRAGTTVATASVGGTPYGPLTWTVATSDGSALPAWIATTDGTCVAGSTTCGLTAAPGAGVPLGSYPANGSVTITGADQGGSTVAFSPLRFTVAETGVQAATATTSYAGRIGKSLTTAAVTASGGSAPYAYAIETLSGTAPANATVSASNGAVTATPTALGTWIYRIRVTSASDPANVARTEQVSVAMDPAFSVSVPDITMHATLNYYTYTAVNNVLTPVVTGAKGPVTWGASNVSFVRVDPTSGKVTVDNSFQINGDIAYQVVATDTSDGSKSTLTGKVRRLSSPSIPNRSTTLTLRKGAPYKSHYLGQNETVGVPGYPVYTTTNVTWDGNNQYQSCGDGSLLDGLQLGQDGYVTGTYTGPVATQGAYLKGACYRATDYDGAYAGTLLSFYVADPLAISGLAPTVQLSQGIDYAGQLTLANAVGKVTWSVAGTRPTGISFTADGSTYRISGRPGDAKDYSVTVTAVDAWDGTSVSRTILFKGAAQPVVTNPPAATARYTANFTFQAPSVTGGTAPYTWSFSPNSSAQGASISINPATGVVSGRNKLPAAKNYFVLRVTDANGVIGDSPALLLNTATNAIALTTPSVSFPVQFHAGATRAVQAVVSSAPKASFLASFDDGTATVGGGSSADWLSISDKGLITGSPGANAASGSFTWVVVDATDGAYASFGTSGQIVPPLSFSRQPASIRGAPGVAIPTMYPVTTSNVGALAFRLMNGTSDISGSFAGLCPGLSFELGDGSISGQPTATCSLPSLTIAAMDKGDGTGAVSNAFDVSVATGTAASITGYSKVFVQDKAQSTFVSASLANTIYNALSDGNVGTAYTVDANGGSRPNPYLNAYFDKGYTASAVALNAQCGTGTFWLVVNDQFIDLNVASYNGQYALPAGTSVSNVGIQCKTAGTTATVRSLMPLP